MGGRFSNQPRASNNYSSIYTKVAECFIGDGSETYSNTEPINWNGWMGKYNHTGMRPPEFYYPKGPYSINGIEIPEGAGCRAVGITDFTTQQSSGFGGSLTNGTGQYTGNGCLIIFGRRGTRSGATIPTSLGSFEELSRLTFTFSAFASPGPYATTASGVWGSPYEVGYVCNECCDIKYMVISGDFPPEMTLNMETGIAQGILTDVDMWMERWKQNGKAIGPTESNYGTVGSASAFKNGLPANIIARFIIRAFNARDPRVFTDKEFTVTITNSWNSDRDKFILNINSKFFINGSPTTNSTYLSEMKKKGYF